MPPPPDPGTVINYYCTIRKTWIKRRSDSYSCKHERKEEESIIKLISIMLCLAIWCPWLGTAIGCYYLCFCVCSQYLFLDQWTFFYDRICLPFFFFFMFNMTVCCKLTNTQSVVAIYSLLVKCMRFDVMPWYQSSDINALCYDIIIIIIITANDYTVAIYVFYIAVCNWMN